MCKAGLYIESKFKDFTKLQYNFFEFIKTANFTFMNNDWYDVFKEYSNDEKALIIIDPPYLLTHNMFYQILIQIYMNSFPLTI